MWCTGLLAHPVNQCSMMTAMGLTWCNRWFLTCPISIGYNEPAISWFSFFAAKVLFTDGFKGKTFVYEFCVLCILVDRLYTVKYSQYTKFVNESFAFETVREQYYQIFHINQYFTLVSITLKFEICQMKYVAGYLFFQAAFDLTALKESDFEAGFKSVIGLLIW